MTVKNVEKLEKSRVAVTVEVGAEEFEAAVAKAYAKARGKLSIPGFRPGKAPRKMIEKLYGAGVFYSDAVDIALPEAYTQAIGQSGLDVVGYPEIEIVDDKIDENGFTFKATVAVYPEVKLGEYKGLTAEKEEIKVSADDVKERLNEMAERNARHALMRYMMRTGYSDDRTNQALLQLESALALDAPPMRIECFDISTLHGAFTVASMVVFTNGKPDKSQYRRFKIRAELDEANDFVSMSEVLGRRYAPERMADERFGSRPDLLVVDGGRPQLTAAMRQLEELGLDIPVCGLAKADEEVFVPWDDTPIVLPSGSASLYLIKQVRDESHRFAITFHRELRGKAMTASVLDEVPGVGPTRKKAIMRHFGSMKRLRAASVEEIESVKGVPADVARAVHESLRALDADRVAGVQE